ncbi:hypothetical protein CICLE_v10006239mg [Citrus x clementina]|uniref:Uncharacterized protein n=1 Tax=Citrus clementina TaxID=85681 RepID=V4S6A4_CITCL|nr:hypothetical protein CICLE_v10006239mg [Citrus x clementina]
MTFLYTEREDVFAAAAASLVKATVRTPSSIEVLLKLDRFTPSGKSKVLETLQNRLRIVPPSAIFSSLVSVSTLSLISIFTSSIFAAESINLLDSVMNASGSMLMLSDMTQDRIDKTKTI